MPDLPSLASPWLAVAFHALGAEVTWIELLAFLLSLAMVACNMRVLPAAWPLAIASSALYGLLFLHFRLYGEAGLQIIFIVLGAWGWTQWLRGRSPDGSELRVHRLDGPGARRALGLTLLAWPLLGTLLDQITDSDVPYFDALPTVGSVTGQILLGRKLLENWLVWLLVNGVSVLLFAYKGLWLTVLLYAIFLVLSWHGWQAWRAIEGRARG